MRRFPRGKRGLKSVIDLTGPRAEESLPPREAWIEIKLTKVLGKKDESLPPREAWIEISSRQMCLRQSMSLPPREAWIEILSLRFFARLSSSLPPREAWIEILHTFAAHTFGTRVASPAGSVD